MSTLKQIADSKIRDVPSVLRRFLSFKYLREQFDQACDTYAKKYIATNSMMPFWHFIYGGTLFSYICIWPTEYEHYKHKEKARLKGETH